MSMKKQVEALFAPADVRINENLPWDIIVKDERFYQRVLADGTLGIGESYMDGLWDCKKLDDFHSALNESAWKKA